MMKLKVRDWNMIGKHISALLILMIAFSSCNKSDQKIPKDVLPKDTMVLVLEDMEIIESGLTIMANEGKDVKPLVVPYYSKLMEKYHIDSLRLAKSLDFYIRNSKYLDQVYQKSLDELMQNQSKNRYQK